MAYTYDEFVTQANKTGMMSQFGQSDLQMAQKNPEYGMALLGLYQEKNRATTAEQRALADEAVNQLRVNYNTLGQISEAQKQIDNADAFTYSGETAYQQALKDAEQMPEFSYDKEDDPVYRAMRQTARRESQRAMEDTLARASAGTGGVASSYAVTAAQQAANNYVGALSDAVPTLYQQALSEHKAEQARRDQVVQNHENAKLTEQDAYNERMKLLYGNLGGLQDQLAEGNAAYIDSLNAMQTAMGTLSKADILQLKSMYPNGVTDADVWKVLVDRYGEGQLTVNGIKLSNGGESTVDRPGTVDVGTGSNKLTEEEIQQMKASYPGGVADAGVWKVLVDRYGEEQLTAAGIKPAGAAAVPMATLTYLKTAFPNGVVTNATYWQMLLASGLKEADLNAAGYRLESGKTPQEETPTAIVSGKGQGMRDGINQIFR